MTLGRSSNPGGVTLYITVDLSSEMPIQAVHQAEVWVYRIVVIVLIVIMWSQKVCV